MNSQFTFGVEIELAVALVLEDQEHPDPSETRTVIFPATDSPDDISNIYRQPGRPPLPAVYYHPRIQNEFIRVIAEAGFRVSENVKDSKDLTSWSLTNDSSIGHPPDPTDEHPLEDDEGYHWTGVEVVSPAFLFCSESLDEVRRMCKLLSKHFKFVTNRTTGLHVHVGHAQKGFNPIHVSQILAFFYCFEPQIDTVHPIHRYNHEFGKSMRDRCNYTKYFQETYGEVPSTLTVLTKLLTLKRSKPERLLGKLTSLTRVGADGKMGNYNFNGVSTLPRRAARPTIEFRQHEGTCDGERIIQWVKTVVGMLEFVESEDYASFADLLTTVTQNETWTKQGDGKDVEREEQMGPTLADRGWTVIDLLEHIGLQEQADYYRGKTHKHNMPPRMRYRNILSPFRWKYAQRASRESEEYKTDDTWRRLFDKMLIVKNASNLAGVECSFDEDGPLWPQHEASNYYHDEDSNTSESESSLTL
ncbi:hypothetical protein BUE80_DR008253 [Diplocarpon rosae]|nr:hypothetical protein BUE80_DR008253 [Diplocarpon rosae]